MIHSAAQLLRFVRPGAPESPGTITKPVLSVVIPVYRAEGIVDELIRRLSVALSEITQNYEIVLVDDGSPDASWQEIQQQASVLRV